MVAPNNTTTHVAQGGGHKAFCKIAYAVFLLTAVFTGVDAFTSPIRCGAQLRGRFLSAATSSSRLSASTMSTTSVGSRMPINEDYPGLKRVHSNPDVFTIEGFLDDASCDDLINKAKEKGTERSPVAYAGWTDDVKELLGLAASGPVSWGAILGAWYEAQGDVEASIPSLVLHALRNYVGLFVVSLVGIAAFTKFRADSLQNLRTSSSTTLDDLTQSGAKNFVLASSELYGPTSTDMPAASYFEAPTVISYEKDQALAPHYDANRSADVEDANRGGQTLSTLLVYLNDVEQGKQRRYAITCIGWPLSSCNLHFQLLIQCRGYHKIWETTCSIGL